MMMWYPFPLLPHSSDSFVTAPRSLSRSPPRSPEGKPPVENFKVRHTSYYSNHRCTILCTTSALMITSHPMDLSLYITQSLLTLCLLFDPTLLLATGTRSLTVPLFIHLH